MEVKEEQSIVKSACCVCGVEEVMSSCNIIDSFIKYKDSFVPFAVVVLETLNYEVSSRVESRAFRCSNHSLLTRFQSKNVPP